MRVWSVGAGAWGQARGWRWRKLMARLDYAQTNGALGCWDYIYSDLQSAISSAFSASTMHSSSSTAIGGAASFFSAGGAPA